MTGDRVERQPADEPRAGQAALLEGAFREVQADLLAYLRLVAGPAAEDVAAQTWADAVAGISGFGGDSADLRRWLFAIARRRAIDHRRRWWQRKVTPLPPQELEPAAGTAVPAEDHEATRWALGQIAALPADQAEVVLLRVVAGLSAEDVGALTGRTPSAVRVMQHRALRRLARQLGRDDGSQV